MLEFKLPDIGEGIATADIVAWKVAEGEHVHEDQELVEIQTDKAIVAIPCPTTGVVMQLCGAEGDTLDVGSLLAVFAPDGDGAGADGGAELLDASASTRRTTAQQPPPSPGSPRPGTPAQPAGQAAARPLASPATRHRARELGVALADIAGSGPRGRITKDDVERTAAPTSTPNVGRPAPGATTTDVRPAVGGEVVPLRGVRRAIARALTQAWQEVPRVIDYREVDATNLLAARRSLKQAATDRGDEALAKAMTPTPLIALAALRAIGDHPYVNASIDLERDEITLHRHVNLGFATASPEGLVVPVLHDAAGRGLHEIAHAIVALTTAARERRLRPEQLAGATFTVNNYGGLGIWLGTPIVRPPEVCNLGVGAIRDQVVAVGGQPVVRPTFALAVAADHRVLDADTLAAFVGQLVALLEEPYALLLESSA